MKSHQIELMKSWYDKTGGKFIPDFVVMQNFRLEEADKFLASGSNWSNLMKIKNFAQTPEARDAMLKLAYSFGAFDQDQRGFKKLQDLLTGLPKKIDLEQAYIFEQIDQQINLHSQRGVFFGVKSRSYTDSEGNIHTTRESFPSSKVEESYQK
jgi:F0F1-type ATP synthase alpha subunit